MHNLINSILVLKNKGERPGVSKGSFAWFDCARFCSSKKEEEHVQAI
jgi:hypothetical protein